MSGRLGLMSTDFLSKYYSGRPAGKNITIDGPAGTVSNCWKPSIGTTPNF